MTLVLLPGLDGTGQLFAPFLAALAGRLPTQCVSVSPDRHEPRSVFGRRVVADWPAGPVVLVGQSYSAAVAVRVAALAPPGLAGLVLASPAFATALPAWARWSARAVPARLMPRPPAWALRWLLCGGDAAVGTALHRAVRSVPAAVLAARWKEFVRGATADDPAEVRVPVLALRAGRDRLFGRHDAPPRPGVTWRTIDGPHMLLACRPAASASAVVEFASALGS